LGGNFGWGVARWRQVRLGLPQAIGLAPEAPEASAAKP